jgi:predicted RNase H-like HicB family nuclease
VPSQQDRVAKGATAEKTEREIAEAIRFHIEGLKEDGVSLREAVSRWSLWRLSCANA